MSGIGVWAVDSADGNELTSGLSEHDCHRVAKSHATRLGEPVYLYEVGSDEEAEEVEPAPGSPDTELDDTDACLQCDAAEAQEDARRLAGDE